MEENQFTNTVLKLKQRKTGNTCIKYHKPGFLMVKLKLQHYNGASPLLIILSPETGSNTLTYSLDLPVIIYINALYHNKNKLTSVLP